MICGALFTYKMHQIALKLLHFPHIFWAGIPPEPSAGLRAYGASTRASGPHVSGLELPSRTWNFLHLQVLRSCNFFTWISNTGGKSSNLPGKSGS